MHTYIYIYKRPIDGHGTRPPLLRGECKGTGGTSRGDAYTNGLGAPLTESIGDVLPHRIAWIELAWMLVELKSPLRGIVPAPKTGQRPGDEPCRGRRGGRSPQPLTPSHGL